MAKSCLKEIAYHKIKEKIIGCEYLPSDFIRECDLTTELNVSRTPIREALVMLEQENFVKILPKRGVMVREIGFREVNEIYEVRMLVEPYILSACFEQVSGERLAELRHEFEAAEASGVSDRAYAADDAFHCHLREICGNQYFTTLLENIYAQTNRLRILSGREKTRLAESIREHVELIDCILSGKREESVKRLEEHIVHSKESAVRYLMSGGLTGL